jgi:hypothetical protein
MNNYTSDPGDEIEDGIFDYFSQHPASARQSDSWIDDHDEE